MAIKFIDEFEITDQRVLVRCDFDVSKNPDNTIADDIRIRGNVPTLEYLIQNNNRVIIIAKSGRPEGRNEKDSLAIVVERLRKYMPEYEIMLISDFLSEPKETFENQTSNQILVLENIRFYPEEKTGDENFAKKIAELGDVYVNDAFAMCHRKEASVYTITKFLPSYGGLLLKKELWMIKRAMEESAHPFISIIGGAKVETKIKVIEKLSEISERILIGGALANTFLVAKGYKIGRSKYESDYVETAKRLIELVRENNSEIVLPEDVMLGELDVVKDDDVHKKVEDMTDDDSMILDIGPETEAYWGNILANARTIIWNGPVGYTENPSFVRGTEFVYYTMAYNEPALTIVGGGDTTAAISHEEYLDRIDHISTGGGAMLELIEKGSLPAIEVLGRDN